MVLEYYEAERESSAQVLCWLRQVPRVSFPVALQAPFELRLLRQTKPVKRAATPAETSRRHAAEWIAARLSRLPRAEIRRATPPGFLRAARGAAR